MSSEDPDFPGYDNEQGDAFDPEYLRRRAENSPLDWRRWLRLGSVLEQRCESAEAVIALERAARLNPHNGLAHYLLGRAMCQEGQRVKGALELATAVRLRPDYVHAWRMLGAIHLKAGRADDALEAWLHAARLAPDGDTYWSVATCFIAQRRFAEATVALEEAVRLKPIHTVAHRALAFLGRMRDEPDVMRRHLLQLFTLDEDMAREAEADLGL